MSELAWNTIVAGLIGDRLQKPRTAGVTMVIDTGVGPRQMRDVLELAGHCIDHWKFGFGTSAFHTRRVLADKLALLAEYGILSLPGGTLLEVALVEHHCRDYMKHAANLGFSAIEISDGTIPLSALRRRNIILCARDAGLIPITEVGKKDPRQQPAPTELAEQALADFGDGAEWVVVEGRESGKAVGIYDQHGQVINDSVSIIRDALGDAANRLIWEAPLQEQQTCLIRCFGTNVGLGNIHPDQVLSVESLRCRLRFDTMHWITDELIRTGAWNPDKVETPATVQPMARKTS